MVGIYMIRSKRKPARIYIGSSINVKYRWGMHMNDLLKQKHHSAKLQNHYNKYGKDDLSFVPIIGCNKEDLVITEQFFIDLYQPYFNVSKIAGKGTNLGLKFSDEHKHKISEALKGNRNGIGHIVSVERRLKMSQINTGRIASEETRIKISLSKKGKPIASKGKKRGHPWNYGKKGVQIPWNKNMKGVYHLKRKSNEVN